MCGGGGGERESPGPNIRLQTVEPTRPETARPKTSRPSQSRKGDRPASSRKVEQSGSSSQGDRKPPGSSHGKKRPSTSGPSSRKDVRSSSSSSRQRPSSSREHASHQSDSQRRTRIDTIPENRPVQYTEDQTIISRVAELHTLIDQHAENFYFHDDIVGSDPELDDSRTRHAIIRRRIAKRIIDENISSNIDIQTTATHLSNEFTHYAFPDSNYQRESHMYELCKLGEDLRGLILSNPSTWGFGLWDEIRGSQSRYGYIMVFPTLLRDEEQAAPRRIFRI